MPVVVVMDPVPVRDVLATTVVVVSGGRHGATHDLAQWGVSRSGREGVMAVGRFCRNALVHPNGSARPWVPWCGYSVLTSVECILNLSIAVPADKGPVRSWSHCESTVINNNVLNNNNGSMMR